MPERSAHGVSLHLFGLLQKLADRNAVEAMAGVKEGLAQLGLEEHLVPVEKDDDISLEPKSEYGSWVLRELKSRVDFIPCPDAQCESGDDGSCRWCGKMMK